MMVLDLEDAMRKMAGGRKHGLALFLGQPYGSETAYQHWHDEHRAKDDEHWRVWVFKVRVQAQSRERDDSKIEHVTNNGKGLTGKESVTRPLIASTPKATITSARGPVLVPLTGNVRAVTAFKTATTEASRPL